MIGIDIGGTNLLIGIVENGTVLKRHHEEICAKGDFERVAKQVSIFPIIPSISYRIQF